MGQFTNWYRQRFWNGPANLRELTPDQHGGSRPLSLYSSNNHVDQIVQQDFYETIEVLVTFDRTYSSGEVNRLLRSLGATLHYDIYRFAGLKKTYHYGNLKTMGIITSLTKIRKLMLKILRIA